MIKVEKTEKTGQIKVFIDNGDLKLINSLKESYGLKNEEAFIKFSVAALLEGNNHEGLFTIKKNKEDKRVLSRITPPEELLDIKDELCQEKK